LKFLKKDFFALNQIIKIKGGTPLKGNVKASGAKNAITKLLVASLLSDKKCIFHNVPNISEVDITIELVKEIGAEIFWDREKKIIETQTKHIKTSSISQRFSGANRIPILILGTLISRTTEEIQVPLVGGDNLGARPVNFHVQALKNLGANIYSLEKNKEKVFSAQAKNGLTGNLITLPFPSVGATENSILASVKAKGITVIQNAAMEPEIIDLILFLQKIGVNITVDVNRTIYIQETKKFNEAEHFVLSDRNEVASYALAAISTKGRVFIEGASHLHMITFLNKLREVGGGFKIGKNGIEFFYDGELKGGVLIETDVHPGFMTDWQQPFGVLFTQCKGSSVIHETVYENRFGYTKTLKEMGADVELFTQCLGNKKCRFSKLNHHHSVIIRGPTDLRGKKIKIPDLRAGFSYVMAALLAKDESHILDVHYLDRGYENIVEKLSSLGANIQRTGERNSLKPFLSKITI
jgi:UDP-N-acetylglucosamine 1-carboxyvinyltransferase